MLSQSLEIISPIPSGVVSPLIPQAMTTQSFRQKQYIKVSKTTRKEILSKLINDGLSLTQVSDMFKVNPSTCRVILNTFKEFGRIGKKQTRKTKFRISTTVNFSILNPLTRLPFEALPFTQEDEMFVEKKDWAQSCNTQLTTILKSTLQDSLNSTINAIHQAALQDRSSVGMDLLNATNRACQAIQVKLVRDHKQLLLMKKMTSAPDPELIKRVLLQQAIQQANYRQMCEQAQQNSMLQIHQIQYSLLQNQLFGIKQEVIKQEVTTKQEVEN